MRINITGFTNAQKTGLSRKEVIGVASLIKDILIDNNYEADYELEDADINIVSVLDLSSINASNALNCLEILRNKNSIIMFDDWNIKGFYKTIDGILNNKFSKTHPCINYKELMSYKDVIERLQKGEYKVIYPAYKTGNHDLLEIRGEKYCLDPSIYIKKDYIENDNTDLIAVHASLAGKWSWLNKKKYTILNLRNEKESKVFEYYCKYRIVMTPPHYHDGSGWFRNRYSLANIAKAVIIEDYSNVFGDTYKLERKDITSKNIDKLFDMQNKAYYETIMSKEEISKVLERIFK